MAYDPRSGRNSGGIDQGTRRQREGWGDLYNYDSTSPGPDMESGPPRGGGGGAPPIQCPDYQTPYNSPVRGWVCVGNRPGSGRPPGGGGFGNFNYQTPAYTGPTRPEYNIGPAPEFLAPGFNTPTEDSIYADPSYKFRLGEGLGALESSAAARGVLRSGGTLRDVQDYAQDYASQEYGNIFNRAMQDYQRRYEAALSEYYPRFEEWQTRSGAEIGAGNLAFQAALDRYFFNVNDLFRNRELVFNAGLA